MTGAIDTNMIAPRENGHAHSCKCQECREDDKEEFERLLDDGWQHDSDMESR